MQVTSLSTKRRDFIVVIALWASSLLLMVLLAVTHIDSLWLAYLDALDASNKASEATYLARYALNKITALNNSKLNSTNGGNFVTLGIFKITYLASFNTPTAGTTKISVRVTDTSKGFEDVVVTGYKKVAL